MGNRLQIKIQEMTLDRPKPKNLYQAAERSCQDWLESRGQLRLVPLVYSVHHEFLADAFGIANLDVDKKPTAQILEELWERITREKK